MTIFFQSMKGISPLLVFCRTCLRLSLRLWKRCKLIFSLDPKVSYVLWIWCNFQAGSVLRNRYVSSILFIIMFLLLFCFVLFTSTSYFVDVNSFVASFSFKTFQRLSMLFKTLLKPGTRHAFAAITNCEISVFFVLRDFGTFCNGINSGEKRAQWPADQVIWPTIKSS